MVFRDGQPSLYVNGAFAHKGLPSDFTVHASLSVAGGNPFRGEVGGLDCFPRALSEAELAQLMKTIPAPGAQQNAVPLELSRNADGSLQAIAWQPGDYTITTAAGRTRAISVPEVPGTVLLAGPWEVQFTPGWGAPNKVTFDELTDWTQRPEEGIKHYSGKATYQKAFDLPVSVLRNDGSQFMLDLGKVHDLATVRLNGQTLRTLWLAPWRLDVTKAVRPGKNVLEVEVVNTWHNRLVGDKALPEAQRQTYLTADTVAKNSPLLPAGLLGPVTVQTVRVLMLGNCN